MKWFKVGVAFADTKQIRVPREVMKEIIELAIRSPSSMNTQPWHLYVVTVDEVASFVGFE